MPDRVNIIEDIGKGADVKSVKNPEAASKKKKEQEAIDEKDKSKEDKE